MRKLNERIQHFYDRSTPIWLDTWGEHMHHGYYQVGAKDKDHQQAQLDLVDELLRWGKVEQAAEVLDAGCGVGGSARLLAQKLGCERVLGCTLSPVQAERGMAYTQAAGLSGKVSIIAKDMMSLGPEDGPFDLIWSLESAEHIEDKAAMMQLFYRLLKPGGKLLMATWCHRETPPALNHKDQQILERIGHLYHLPPLVSINELSFQAKQAGFEQVVTDDWSDAVAPFWKAVIRSALTRRSFSGLLKAGLPTIKGAWAMRYMMQGYRRSLIRFGLLQGQKI